MIFPFRAIGFSSGLFAPSALLFSLFRSEPCAYPITRSKDGSSFRLHGGSGGSSPRDPPVCPTWYLVFSLDICIVSRPFQCCAPPSTFLFVNIIKGLMSASRTIRQLIPFPSGGTRPLSPLLLSFSLSFVLLLVFFLISRPFLRSCTDRTNCRI